MNQLKLLAELVMAYNPVDDSLAMEAMDQEIRQAARALPNTLSLNPILTVIEHHPISIKLHLLCLLASPRQPEIKLALEKIAHETQNSLHLSAALAGYMLSGRDVPQELLEKLINLLPKSLNAKKRALQEIQETFEEVSKK